jgi:hypothetical protein
LRRAHESVLPVDGIIAVFLGKRVAGRHAPYLFPLLSLLLRVAYPIDDDESHRFGEKNGNGRHGEF